MDELRTLFRAHQTIHVVGLSSNPMRASHDVARYLQEAGFRIVPVNPRESEVLGEPAYPSLRDCSQPITFVNVFRHSESLPELTDDILHLGTVEVVWLQLGVRHPESEQRLREVGITVVSGHCTKVEHAARFP